MKNAANVDSLVVCLDGTYRLTREKYGVLSLGILYKGAPELRARPSRTGGRVWLCHIKFVEACEGFFRRGLLRKGGDEAEHDERSSVNNIKET